ncbi:MAG: hypothetical protein ISR82_07030 [Candidatus Marinimicrobia bacterium]|nr:hypothetical protein [Candidatus Neomarinimicrobiota bacterium]MBL7010957.1 hypothetical protein [Candidatus Neomarinimicrobiota bacterium]MBL7031272.1 hypothetical protein [Candidatus Neomarinimicrobiota bacterium]
MKKTHYLPAIIFLSLGMAQGPSTPLFQQDKGRDENGKWVRDYYKYTVGDIEQLEVDINYGIGELQLDANLKPKLISGAIFYYPSRVEPEIEYTERGGRGNLSIRTHHEKKIDFGIDDRKIGWELTTYENELQFSIPSGIPTILDMDFGLGSANLDFTDLTLSRVKIDCGMGEMNVEMNKPNPIVCDFLKIDTGLGSFEAEGLGNINAREVDIEVGMGSADIDYRGHFTQDVEIDIEVGMGSLELILPENVNVKAKIHHNFLSSVDMDDLIKKGNYYLTQDWESDRPTVTLDISVGLGSVDINLRN